MKKLRRVIYILLVLLTGFMALTTLAGGIGLMANLMGMSTDLLQGSIFKNYFLPGLALFLIAGGSAVLATILLIRKSKFALLSAMAAGIIMMFFEFVEALVIGSPAGAARSLQVLYFGVGTLITILASGAWFIDLSSESV
jgi:hypothetical protein